MVLNKDYISDNEEEDPWELIDGGGGEDENISSEESQQTEQINIADHDNVTSGDNERESLLLQEEEATNQNDDDDDDNVSVTTGVSSITGDNTTISDVDEDGEGVNNIIEGTRLHEQADQFTTSNTSAGSSSSENNTITDNKSTKNSYTTTDDPLVEQLSQMGFEKEHIQKAIDDLREAGSTEIDADSIIGSMVGETVIGSSNNNDENDNNEQNQQHHPTNPFALPLHSTWEFVESTVQEIDNRHQLRHRTQRCVQTINRSAQELWSNVKDESQKFRSNVRQTCDQADVQARNATVHVRTAASSAKDSLVRANEEYGVMEKVAALAIVGGATLLALGNPRAGVASMAIAGASIAAGEAMKSQQQQTRDYGLREGVHLD